MKTKMIIVISGLVIVALVGTLTPVLLLTGEKEPPILQYFTPFWNEVVSGTTQIYIEAVDVGENPSGIKPNGYRLFLDDELVSKTNSYDWDTTQYADGSQHKIVMQASDKKGNKAEWTHIVVVDNTLDPTPSDAFKVMAFNAWESGTVSPTWINLLFEENADIILLSETGIFDNGRNMEVITNQLSGYFYYEAPYTGNATDALAVTDGVAVISRYPILDFHNIAEYRLDDGTTHIYHRAWCDTVVDIRGKITHVIAYHGKCCISDLTNNTLRREQEVEGIINYMDDLGDVPIILGGDFNANSPFDVGDVAPIETGGDLGCGSIRMLLIPDDPVYGNYSSNVHNFTDTWRTMYPHERGWTYGRTNPKYWSRIDYIFVNHHWADKMINGTTGDTPSANTTVDHYTVDCFLSLDEEYVFNSTSIRLETNLLVENQIREDHFIYNFIKARVTSVISEANTINIRKCKK